MATIPFEQRRTDPEWPLVAWEWHNALQRKWVRYPASVEKKLEELYYKLDGENYTYVFMGTNRKKYEVDLGSFRQSNLATEGLRDVRRVAKRPVTLWEQRRGVTNEANELHIFGNQ